MRPEPIPAGDGLYRALLELSTEAIARFELQPPMSVGLAPAGQVEHILRYARVAECNDAFAQLYDRSALEMTGRTVADVIPEDERREVIGRFVASGYRLAHDELAHAGADGSTRWMSVNALGLVVGGRLRGYWITLHDVTERKRMESERERRDRILEAVAFGAARMLEPGPMHAHAEAVLARLGRGADAARAWVVESLEDGDGERVQFRFVWAARGQEIALDDPRLRGGISLRRMGLERMGGELRAGRPVVADVRSLSEAERAFPERMGSKAFAAVPIFANGTYWGFLGFGETRRERAWSASEVESLKTAAAVFGAAIERERADEALHESKERFMRLSAAAFEGIAITEAGAFVDANDQMAKILGCEVADLVGQPVEKFVAEADRALVRSHLQSHSEEPYQHRALTANGSVVPVEIRARAMPYDGRTVRVSAIRDVSERVEAEERQRRLETDLRHAAEQWRQTFDALDLGIVLADPEGRVVRLNRSALELVTGSGFKDAVGRHLEDIADREPWRSLLDINWRVVSGRTSVIGEAREPSTARSYYLLGSPWFRSGGQPPWCVLTFRDVTEYTTMQAQLRRARTLEAMGSLVAGVAHEVRNPLFSISATVDAFENEFGQRPEFAEYSMLLRSQVVRLTQLMRDLLDYGKPSLLRRAPTRLGDVVRRAIRSCAGLARERQVRVEEAVPAEMPTLDVEAARVEQAVENLLANAIQHAPAGSVVRVGISLDGDAGAPRARCTVEDEGPGVAAEDRERLFEPFFSRRKGGTGLGLPIVQRVAEAHGGMVSVENRPEGGARFTLLLPLAEAAEMRRTVRA